MTSKRGLFPRPAALLPALLACADPSDARDLVHRAPPADGVPVGRSAHGATHVRTITGFGDPESVRYDAEQDVFFVSNVAGFGSKKDGNGYIVRIDAAHLNGGTILVSGGQPGVTLHAPRGMTITGIRLLEKSGGRSGHWSAADAR